MYQKIMSKQEVVKTAEDYSRVVPEVYPNVTLLYINEDDIVVYHDLMHSLVFMAAESCQASREPIK